MRVRNTILAKTTDIPSAGEKIMFENSNNNVGTGGCQCEAQTLLSNVKLGVVLAHENVAKDPERSTRSWDINRHQSQEAIIIVRDHGFLVVELKLLPAEGEREMDFRAAIDNEFLAQNDLCIQSLANGLGNFRRASKQ